MNSREYLLTCKVRLKIDSNYRLAKELEIAEADINYCMQGKRSLSVYACFRVAECLGINPTEIIAQIALESEKNESKKNYFRNFLKSCSIAVTGIFLIAALSITTNDERGYAV
jgi:plasmid maintenance system antidote protein VapI